MSGVRVAHAVERARATVEAARPSRVVLLVAFLVGSLVCGAWSWQPSLWTDEAATISAATRSIGELLAMAQTIDAVHSTYYAGMHLWLQIVPVSAFWLRLPSAVAGGLTTAGVLLIGQRLGGRRLGVLAAAVFVLLPRTTWMGMEARPYAMTALLAVAATGVLVVAVERGGHASRSRRPLGLRAVYSVLVGLGVAMNVYVGLLVVGHAVTLLLLHDVDWSFRGWWVLSAFLGGLIFSPVVWTAVHQTGQLGGGDFGWLTWARNVVVNQWFLGETPTLSTGGSLLSGGASWKLAATVLALLCWCVVALGLRSAPTAPVVCWAAPWIVVPTLVIGLYSVTVHNMYSARYFTFATAGTALLVAHGLGQLVRPKVRSLLLVLMVLVSIPVYVSQRQPYAKSGADWAQLAEFVGASSRAGDGVYFAPRYPTDGPVVRQTTRGIATAYPRAFAGLVDVTLVSPAVQDDDLTGRSALLDASAARWEPLRAVWVVRRHDADDKEQDDRRLQAAGFVVGARWDGPLDEVVEYRRDQR